MYSLPFVITAACLVAVLVYIVVRRSWRGRAPGARVDRLPLTREQAEAERAMRLRLTEIELERDRRSQRHMGSTR